jgi:spermidine synthase
MVLLAIAAGGLVMLAAFKMRPESARRTAILYAISTTGFFGMAMNLALIFSFQMRYGYVYQIIGALTAIFMAGAAAGSIARHYIFGRKQSLDHLIFNEAAIAVFVLISFLIISRLQYGIFLTPLYMILCFLAGLLLGAEFPLAVSLYSEKGEESGFASGVVFCADLVGGVLAAVLAGVVLLPLLGVGHMLIALVVLKALSAIVLRFVKNMK